MIMPSLFNTDTLKFMGNFRTFLKYVIIGCVFLSLGAGIIQTSTYVEISIQGHFDVDSEDSSNSGVVYLTTLGGKSMDGSSTEETAWTEVTDRENNTVEEMNEGPYEFNPFSSQGWIKYAWETEDNWPAQLQKSRGTMDSLARRGWVKHPFSPTQQQQSDAGFYVGFNGNPEITSDDGNARFKKNISENRRVGIGAFLIVSPNAGHQIERISIRSLGASGSSAGWITYQSPQRTPITSSSQWLLDFDHDFLHSDCNLSYDNQGWYLDNETQTFCAGPSRTAPEPRDSHWFSSGPNEAMMQVGNSIFINESRHQIYNGKMAYTYSLSPNSEFTSRECVGCAHHDEWTTNLWNKVWRFMNGKIPPTALTTDFKLPTNKIRNELPVVLGLSWGYAGGDLWIWDAIAGHSGLFLDVYDEDDISYQIHVEFSQIGYKINAKIYDLDTTPILPNTNVSHLLSWNQTPQSKNLNPDSPNLLKDTDVSLTFGGSINYCIERVDATVYKRSGDSDDPNASVETLYLHKTENTLTETNAEKLNENILAFPLALGESMVFGTPNTALSDIDRLNINKIDWNYDIKIHTFSPKFKLTSNDNGAYGTITNGHYLRPTSFNDIKNDATTSNANIRQYFRDQKILGSAPNERAVCGFKGYYQEITIAPNMDDYYYFDQFIESNAEVYTYDVFDAPEAPDKLTRYSGNDTANVKYASNPFTAYAKVTSSGNAWVDVVFKRFPQIQLTSFIGSNLVGRVTPNRQTTYRDNRIEYDRNTADTPTRDIMFIDEFPDYFIQPISYTQNTHYGLVFDIHKKLQRLYLEYNNRPIVVFAPNNHTANTGTITLSGHHEANLPNNETVTSNSLAFEAELSGNSTDGYELKLPFIQENTRIIIDFTPFQISFSTITNNVTLHPTLNAGITATDVDDASGDNIMDKTINATNNEIKQIELTMHGTKRAQYYIYDIIEEQTTDTGTKITPPTSQINRLFSDLKANLFHYLQNDTAYSSTPIVRDTNIYVAVEKYKTIQYQLTDDSEPNGRIEFDTSGLIAPGPNNHSSTIIDLETPSTDWQSIEQNTIYTSATIASNVGFRRWDTAILRIIPDPGYYVASVRTYTSHDDDAPTNNNVFEETYSLPSVLDTVGGKEWRMAEVSKNAWVRVKFKEKPSINTFWLGTDI
jgi:hypothetical protein